MDPKSVLANQVDKHPGDNWTPASKSNDTAFAEESPTPSQDSPTVNLEGFLTEHQLPSVAGPVRNPAPSLGYAPPQTESVERSCVPASEKSYADIVDSMVLPAGQSNV